MTKEQKERNREWVRRLKSGKIKQCRGCLGRGEARCCLGVARDIYMEATGATKAVVGRQKDGFPSPVVAEWFGWDSCVLMLDGTVATYRNDTLKQDFPTIAKAAEKEFHIRAGRGK